MGHMKIRGVHQLRSITANLTSCASETPPPVACTILWMSSAPGFVAPLMTREMVDELTPTLLARSFCSNLFAAR